MLYVRLKQGITLLQGLVALGVDAHNTAIFKDNVKINFDEQFLLIAVACNK